ALTVLASYVAVRHMRVTRTHLLQAKACLAFLNVAPGACLGEKVLENVPALRAWANRLDGMGFLRPGLLKSGRVSEFADDEQAAPASHGTFEITDAGDGTYTAQGTATLARRGEPADAVALAYEDGAGEAHVFALAEIEGAWTIYGSLRQFSPRRYVRWRKAFAAGELPPQAVALSAWAFDAETGSAQRIGGTRPFRRAE
ncbi:MAG TPA: hypothetical protein VD968_09710, partial [Pyrinomonadaceae bacterium]|nr:hypothetical protein [Pyrinomonadaceae bacterium]